MSNSSFLNDEQQYFVYRVILYCKEFEAAVPLFPKDSLSRCYIIHWISLFIDPSNLHQFEQSHTPPGISTNQMLELHIQDIMKGTPKNFEEPDSKRNSFLIFLDVCGALEGHAALFEAFYVIYFRKGAPCTYCIFCLQSIY